MSSAHKYFAAAFAVVLALAALNASADIYRWDNGQVIPGTESIFPTPGLWIGSTPACEYANLALLDLSYSTFDETNLAYTTFAGSNLQYAQFNGPNLASANFVNADLSGAYIAAALTTHANFSN